VTTIPEPKAALAAQAARLRALHVPGEPLILPNAWDAATAGAVVAAGYPVVATSSGAMAESLGYADHEQAPATEMLAAVGRIARAVDVPVTADLEAGYSWSASDLVEGLLEAGGVGCNLEDTEHARGGRRAPEAQAEWLGLVRAAAAEAGVSVVLNARIDTWLHPGSETDRLTDAVHRARLYLAAGADCVFPIGLGDADAIRRFVAAVDAPVNVLRRPGQPLADLARLGVARISHGTSLFRQQQEAWRDRLAALR
jgi:2-methylisocitrate lyase-like PEP mutase family enzyme